MGGSLFAALRFCLQSYAKKFFFRMLLGYSARFCDELQKCPKTLVCRLC